MDTPPAQRPLSPLHPTVRTPRHIPPPICQRGDLSTIPRIPVSSIPAHHRSRIRHQLLLPFPEERRGQHYMPPLQQTSYHQPHPIQLRPLLVPMHHDYRMRQIISLLHLLRQQDASTLPSSNTKPPAPTPCSHRPSGSFHSLGPVFTFS
jgi:hypothetical protein